MSLPLPEKQSKGLKPGDQPHVDPLAQTIARWRWALVTPLDEQTARRIGGGIF